MHKPRITRSKTRQLLDTWQFWVGIAYLGLVVMTVALWVNYVRVSADQRRTAIVIAEREADIQAQYLQCVKNAPLVAKFDKFVQNVEIVHATLLKNSIESHRATPRSSALYRAQIRNIRRLRNAQIDVKGLKIPIVTQKDCLAARNGRTDR